MIHALLPLILNSAASPPNLLENGDFEEGAQGFVTAYRQSSSLFEEGMFAVTTDPRKLHVGAASVRDHTSKAGNMLAINGSMKAGLTVWQASVKVKPRQTYTFSGWTTSWSMDPNSGLARDTSPAILRLYVNGKPSGAIYGVNSKSGSWSKFTYEWESGSNAVVTLRLVDANIDGVGNDFALDDLSFTSAQ
jgi:hypothetical protein